MKITFLGTKSNIPTVVDGHEFRTALLVQSSDGKKVLINTADVDPKIINTADEIVLTGRARINYEGLTDKRVKSVVMPLGTDEVLDGEIFLIKNRNVISKNSSHSVGSLTINFMLDENKEFMDLVLEDGDDSVGVFIEFPIPERVDGFKDYDFTIFGSSNGETVEIVAVKDSEKVLASNIAIVTKLTAQGILNSASYRKELNTLTKREDFMVPTDGFTINISSEKEFTKRLKRGQDVSKLSEEELIVGHVSLHIAFESLAEGKAFRDWSTDQVISEHAKVAQEMVDRDIEHSAISKLDETFDPAAKKKGILNSLFKKFASKNAEEAEGVIKQKEVVADINDSKWICDFAEVIKQIKGTKVIDFGCGEGDALASLHKSGFDVVGIERNDKRIKAAKEKGLEVIRANIEEVDELDIATFDSGIMMYTAEHTVDPSKAISKALSIVDRLIIVCTIGHKGFGSFEEFSDIAKSNEYFSRTKQLSNNSALAVISKTCNSLEVAEFIDFSILPNYISLVGSSTKGVEIDVNEPKDIDILIRNDNRDPSLESAIGSQFPKNKRALLHYIYSSTGPITDHVPMFDLVCRSKQEANLVEVDAIEKMKKVDSVDSTYFSNPIKLMSSVGGINLRLFFNPEEAWDNWIKDTKGGVIVDPKLDGDKFSIASDGKGTVLAYDVDGNKVFEGFKSLVDVFKDLNIVVEAVIYKNLITLTDVISVDGEDFTKSPLFERREKLISVFSEKDVKLINWLVVKDRDAFIKAVSELRIGSEVSGVLVKLLDSLYESGSSKLWGIVKNYIAVVAKVAGVYSKPNSKSGVRYTCAIRDDNNESRTIGNTFLDSSVNAAKGDNIVVAVTDVARNEKSEGEVYYSWSNATPIGKTKEEPYSFKEMDFLSVGVKGQLVKERPLRVPEDKEPEKINKQEKVETNVVKDEDDIYYASPAKIISVAPMVLADYLEGFKDKNSIPDELAKAFEVLLLKQKGDSDEYDKEIANRKGYFLDEPTGENFIYQHHIVGLTEDEVKLSEGEMQEEGITASVHGDLRFNWADKYLEGITLYTPGNFKKSVGDKLLDFPSMKKDIAGTSKNPQPKEWLSIDNRKLPPGSAGARDGSWAGIFKQLAGTFLPSVQEKGYHEFLMKFIDKPELNGLWALSSKGLVGADVKWIFRRLDTLEPYFVRHPKEAEAKKLPDWQKPNAERFFS